MKRIKLTVAYDGTHYSGWQIQPSAPTIEKKLDRAIYTLTGEKLQAEPMQACTDLAMWLSLIRNRQFPVPASAMR